MDTLTVAEYFSLIGGDEILTKNLDTASMTLNLPASPGIAPKPAASVSPRTTRLVISTNDVDRCKDILNPLGCSLDNFKSNPLFLWEHGKKYPLEDSILGRAIQIDQFPDRIEAVVQYANLDHGGLPAKIAELEAKGFLPGASIGWRPLDGITIDRTTGIRYIDKWELLEISKVALPMNGRATHAQLGN